MCFLSAAHAAIEKRANAFTRASLDFLENGELLELGSGTHWVSGEEPERIGEILVDFSGRADTGVD